MHRACYLTTLFAVMVFAVGCTSIEGQNPGECADGADNDADGFYDCDDPDCTGSPDCQGDDDDTGDDDSAGDDDTTPECAACVGDYVIENENDMVEINLCDSIAGNLEISGAGWLIDFELPCLESVAGHITVSFNDALISLDGISNLATVGGHMMVVGNDSLPSFDGLSSLVSVGDSLSVTSNGTLTSLDGLSNLTSVGDTLMITLNDSLTGLDGLSSLTTIGGALSIQNNLCLSQAEAETFAASISVGGNVSVTNNGANYPCN